MQPGPREVPQIAAGPQLGPDVRSNNSMGAGAGLGGSFEGIRGVKRSHLVLMV